MVKLEPVSYKKFTLKMLEEALEELFDNDDEKYKALVKQRQETIPTGKITTAFGTITFVDDERFRKKTTRRCKKRAGKNLQEE